MTRIKCRFCGVISEIEETGQSLKRLRKGPAKPCKGNKDILSPGHLEIVETWDEHYEVLEHD
tara:strand:+ start:2024 stop:2209 length:186 start_codon:yes stop_codon:yes gene_type:complete